MMLRCLLLQKVKKHENFEVRVRVGSCLHHFPLTSSKLIVRSMLCSLFCCLFPDQFHWILSIAMWGVWHALLLPQGPRVSFRGYIANNIISKMKQAVQQLNSNNWRSLLCCLTPRIPVTASLHRPTGYCPPFPLSGTSQWLRARRLQFEPLARPSEYRKWPGCLCCLFFPEAIACTAGFAHEHNVHTA